MEFFPSLQFQEEYLCFVVVVVFFRDYITDELPVQLKRFGFMRAGSVCLKTPCKTRRKKQL